MLTARNVQFYDLVKEMFMDELLLREVCELVGVTRRAIQGYEKSGLVAATGKNKMGHLLYNKTAIDTIKEIKRYQDCGFSLTEIKKLKSMSQTEQRQVLESKIKFLETELNKINNSISFLESYIEKL